MSESHFRNLLTAEMLCARRGSGISLYEIFNNECNFKSRTHGVLHQTL